MLQDVWDLCWATDNPELLAIMEKGRLIVLRGTDAEEPVNSSAWLAGFSDLQVGDTWCHKLFETKRDATHLQLNATAESLCSQAGRLAHDQTICQHHVCNLQCASPADLPTCNEYSVKAVCALPLQVHAVLLDEIMQQPQMPELSMVTDYETRSLR